MNVYEHPNPLEQFDQYFEDEVVKNTTYVCIKDNCQQSYVELEVLRDHYLHKHAYIITCCNEELPINDDMGRCPVCWEGMF